MEMRVDFSESMEYLKEAVEAQRKLEAVVVPPFMPQQVFTLPLTSEVQVPFEEDEDEEEEYDYWDDMLSCGCCPCCGCSCDYGIEEDEDGY